MMYPTAVTVIAIGITIFLLVKVVPVFGEIYSGFGAKLPGPTQLLISISNLLKPYILFILPAMGLAVYGWFFSIMTTPGGAVSDGTRIKLAIFRAIEL